MHDGVGTDVLRYAATFRRHDVGLADPVEQRGLAVVDVAENGDDRRPGNEVFGVALVFLGLHRLEHVVLGGPFVNDLEFDAEFQRQHLSGFVVKGGVDRHRLAHGGHHLFDQVIGPHADRLGKRSERDGGLNFRVAFSGRRVDGSMAPLDFPRRTRSLGFFLFVEQGRSRHRRGHADLGLGGALRALGAATGAVGWSSQPPGRPSLALAIFLVVDHRRRRSDGTWAGPRRRSGSSGLNATGRRRRWGPRPGSHPRLRGARRPCQIRGTLGRTLGIRTRTSLNGGLCLTAQLARPHHREEFLAAEALLGLKRLDLGSAAWSSRAATRVRRGTSGTSRRGGRGVIRRGDLREGASRRGIVGVFASPLLTGTIAFRSATAQRRRGLTSGAELPDRLITDTAGRNVIIASERGGSAGVWPRLAGGRSVGASRQRRGTNGDAGGMGRWGSGVGRPPLRALTLSAWGTSAAVRSVPRERTASGPWR